MGARYAERKGQGAKPLGCLDGFHLGHISKYFNTCGVEMFQEAVYLCLRQVPNIDTDKVQNVQESGSKA